MDHTHPEYLLKKDFNYFVTELMDFLKSNFDSLRKEMKEVKQELHVEIKQVHIELQNHKKETVKNFAAIKGSIEDLKHTHEVIKDMNANLLEIQSNHETRIRAVEKKSHTHETHML